MAYFISLDAVLDAIDERRDMYPDNDASLYAYAAREALYFVKRAIERITPVDITSTPNSENLLVGRC